MQRLGPFAGLQQFSEQPSVGVLTIGGTRVSILEDQDAHEAVEQCLVPWMGSLMDRYDARMLLDNLDSFDRFTDQQYARPADTEAGASAEELDAERYADLDYSREHLVCASEIHLHNETGYEDSGSQQEQPLASGVNPHRGPAFSFDYSNSSQQQQQTPGSQSATTHPRVSVVENSSTAGIAEGALEQQYRPPYEQLPSFLEGHVPSNKRQHETILRTAEFVRSNGSQVEVLLRVKHGDNPTFAFLLSRDRLYPYYRWLVEENPPQSCQQQPQHEEHNSLQTMPLQQQSLDSNERQQSQQHTRGTLPGVSHNTDLGALALLRAYSMNSEADSEDPPEQQQQQQPVLQQQEGNSDGGTPGDAESFGDAECNEHKQDQPVVFGPVIPPGIMQGDTAPSGSETRVDTPVQPTADSPAEDKEAVPGGILPQQQQMSAASVTEDVVAAEPAASAVGTGKELPADLPERLKAIIDKLVAFVKRNGIKFESVVRAREANNPKFEFLYPGSWYHSYYRQQLEAALGSQPVQQLFQDLQQQPTAAAVNLPAQQQATGAGPSTDAAEVVAVAVGCPQQGSAAVPAKVVLKANPRLAMKRGPTAPALGVTDNDSEQQNKQLGDQPGSAAAEAAAASNAEDVIGHPDPATEQEQHQQADVEQSAASQLAELPVIGSAEATSATAAGSPGTATNSAALQAQKRLKLQMYLRQKRAEQLAEEQRQEHEAKARAILAHRLLLKRLRSGNDSGLDSSTAAELDPDATAEAAAAADQQLPSEEEEGEIAAQGIAAAAAAVRLEAQQLLQGSQEPVDTTLPGLKELAVSAAAAAAQHRAALMVESDDDDGETGVGEEDAAAKQKRIIEAALKAAREAAAAGGGPALSTCSVSAASTSAVEVTAAGPITNMAAAANAAAAVIAAQASSGGAALLQQQQQLLQQVVQPDTAALVAAAAASAAAAAAALAGSTQQTVLQQQGTQPVSGKRHFSASTSDSGSGCSSGQSDKKQRSAKRRRSSRSCSRPRVRHRSSSIRSELRRGDAPEHKHSHSSNHSRRHGKHRRHSRSRSKDRHRSSSKHNRSRSRSRDKKHAESRKRHRHRSRDRSIGKRHADAAISCSSGPDEHVADVSGDHSSWRNQVAEGAQLTAPAEVPGVQLAEAVDAATPPGLQLLDKDKLRLRLRQMMGNAGV